MKNNYELNTKVIEKYNKEFIKKLNNEKDNDNIEIIDKNNFLIKQGSKELLAYRKGFEKGDIDNIIKNIKLYDQDISIHIGIGNGYQLYQLLKKIESKHTILLIEPIIFLIKNAFKNYDFSKYIEKGNLIICINKEELSMIIPLLDSQKVVNNWHLFVESYTHFMNDYKEVSKTSNEIINQISCNTGTVMGAGAIIAENDIKNLPFIIKHRGVNELKDLYKNKPAVIICSAPSVTELLPQLLNLKIRNNIIIICIAQMLRPLLAFGIKPDFITTVDYGEVNYEHFDNLWYIKDIPLVALNRTYAPILEKWQGAKFIVSNGNPVNEDKTIVEMINKKGFLDQGGSVGHMALGLAVHLGCNPICHIGFDCAYKDGLSHNKLGDANGKINIKEDNTLEWVVTDPNSSLKENNHNMGNNIILDGYFNEKVNTNIGLASFITAMENIFKLYPKIKFINSCENGAKKKYCEQMSFKLFLETYCKKKIDKTKINKYLSLLPNYKNDIEEAKIRLKYEIDLFEKEIESCNKAIKPLEKMQNADNKELKKLLSENEKHAIEAQNIARKSNLLQIHIYKTSREIYNRELLVSGKIKHLQENKNDLEIRIKRSKLILEEAKKSAIKLKEIYNEVYKKLENIDDYNIKKSEIIIKPETWDKLIENGNWARPLLETEYSIENNLNINNLKEINLKCKEMKQKTIEEGLNRPDLTKQIEYNKYIDYSKEYGQKKDFKTALKYLKIANKIMPENIESIWGIATVYSYLQKTNKSLKYYEKLLKIKPDNLRFKFEMGQVYLYKDIQKGIQIINDVMKKTNDFDTFYIRLAELEYGMENYGQAKEYVENYLNICPYSNEAKDLLFNIQNRLILKTN